MMIVLPIRHYNGQHRATEIDVDQRTAGEEISRKK